MAEQERKSTRYEHEIENQGFIIIHNIGFVNGPFCSLLHGFHCHGQACIYAGANAAYTGAYCCGGSGFHSTADQHPCAYPCTGAGIALVLGVG